MRNQLLASALDTSTIVPWGGVGMPWNDPTVSERLLKEHLSQTNDTYSRRIEIINHHVEWLHSNVLERRPARVLDLGCGPGLYTERLASLGHDCVGIDFSPASINYAKNRASVQSLSCEYFEADLAIAPYGGPYDLVFFVFGELGTFPPDQTQAIVDKIYRALAPGGQIVLEMCRLEFLEMLGTRPRTEEKISMGPLSLGSYLKITDSKWFPESKVAVERSTIVNTKTDALSQYTISQQGYTKEEYIALLRRPGFSRITKSGSFGVPMGDPRRIEWSWILRGMRPQQ